MQNRGYSLAIILIGVLVAGLLAGGGYWLLSHKNKALANTTSTTSSNSLPVSSSSPNPTLSPATVPSKVATCNQQISYDSSGVPGPTQCSNGDLNVATWNALAALEPKVLTLGYNPNASQVQSALCSDVVANISNPIEQSIYNIAALYYGWSFSSNPSQVLSNGTCQNTDD